MGVNLFQSRAKGALGVGGSTLVAGHFIKSCPTSGASTDVKRINGEEGGAAKP